MPKARGKSLFVSSQHVWRYPSESYWNLASTTSTTGAYTSVWPTWCASTASTSVTANTCTWDAWARLDIHREMNRLIAAAESSLAAPSPPAPIITADEIEAKARAERLLVENISPKQREQLRLHGYFDVEIGGNTYRIKRGRQGNVFSLDGRGGLIERLCIHPEAYVPDADTMLAQKLLLETDEAAFLRTANHTRLG